MNKQYEPFGKEWEKEISKLPKKWLIDMIRDVQKDKDKEIKELKKLLKQCKKVLCNECEEEAVVCKICFKYILKNKINEVLKDE